MSTLKELLSKIMEKRAEASVDPDECPPSIRSGAGGLVRQAKIDLQNLERQYRMEAVSKAVVLAVHGPYAEEFARLAQKKYGIVIVNFNHFTEELLQRVLKASGSDEFYSTRTHLIMLAALSDLLFDYGITNVPPPTVDYSSGLAYDRPIKEAIYNIMESSYRQSINVLVSSQLIGQYALDMRFDGDLIPVVLYNCSSVGENSTLRPIEYIEINSPVTINSVTSSLTSVFGKYMRPKKVKAKKTNHIVPETPLGEVSGIDSTNDNNQSNGHLSE